MKRLIVAITVALVLTATGAQIAEGLISKLLAFSVKELLVERVFDELWKSAKDYGMKETGHSLYYSARDKTYENLGVEYNDGWESYLQGRTIVVSRIKAYFFDGSKLKDTYLAIQPRFKEEFKKLPEEQQHNLRRTLSNINVSFQLMLQKENQEKYKKWLEGDILSDFGLAEIWLENNLPADEIAKRIRGGELTKTPNQWDLEDKVFEAFPDKDVAKFAGRRLKEGGEDLLKKYIEVIGLAIEDAKM